MTTKDPLLLQPGVGWTALVIGVLFTASVLLGRLPKDVKEKLRRESPLGLIRVWLVGIGLGVAVSGVGIVRQDGFFAFIAILILFIWAIVMKLLIWLKSMENRSKNGDRP